jgi:hypothetical protein
MITLINVFTVEPPNQKMLIDLPTQAADKFASRAPGFFGSTLYRSLDGTKVTMQARWRSVDDYESMRSDPGSVPYLKQALLIAKFDLGMYEVVQSFVPAAG